MVASFRIQNCSFIIRRQWERVSPAHCRILIHFFTSFRFVLRKEMGGRRLRRRGVCAMADGVLKWASLLLLVQIARELGCDFFDAGEVALEFRRERFGEMGFPIRDAGLSEFIENILH